MIYSCTVQRYQLRGYRWPGLLSRTAFCGPCEIYWCITGPVGLLGSTNENWLCARLLSMAVSVYPVVCVHSSRLLETQHYCLWPNGRKGPPSACPPTTTTPHPLPPTHPLISAIRDITLAVKKLSQKPAVNTAQQCYIAMKQ